MAMGACQPQSSLLRNGDAAALTQQARERHGWSDGGREGSVTMQHTLSTKQGEVRGKLALLPPALLSGSPHLARSLRPPEPAAGLSACCPGPPTSSPPTTLVSSRSRPPGSSFIHDTPLTPSLPGAPRRPQPCVHLLLGALGYRLLLGDCQLVVTFHPRGYGNNAQVCCLCVPLRRCFHGLTCHSQGPGERCVSPPSVAGVPLLHLRAQKLAWKDRVGFRECCPDR